jgi:hypothetical protein
MNKRIFATFLITALLMGVTAFFNKPVTLSDDYYWIKKYGWENKGEIVFIGDSRVEDGISPEDISNVTGLKVVNFAFSGQGITPEYLAKAEKCLAEDGKHKALAVGLRPGSFNRPDDSIFVRCDNMSPARRYFWEKTERYSAYFEGLSLGEWKPDRVFYDNGFYALRSEPNEDGLAATLRNFATPGLSNIDKSLADAFLDFVKRCKEKNIDVFAFEMPVADVLKTAEEKKWDKEPFIKDFTAAGGIWLDTENDDYTFMDGQHMLEDSARRFSRGLAEQMKRETNL